MLLSAGMKKRTIALSKNTPENINFNVCKNKEKFTFNQQNSTTSIANEISLIDTAVHKVFCT